MNHPWGHGGATLADPTNIGVGHSGSGDVLGDGKPVVVLDVKRAQIQPGGCDGLATCHVSVRDLTVISPGAEEVPNAMVLLDVTWQSGIGGGEFTIDATQGHMFTCGATTVFRIVARLVSSVDGEAMVPWASKRVEANVHWYGSTQCESLMSLPSVLATFAEGAPVPTAFQRIPLQARSMIAMGLTPAAFPALTAEFSTSDDPSGNGIKYSTLNPNANGTPIVHGVEWVRFTSTTTQVVFATFQMWP